MRGRVLLERVCLWQGFRRVAASALSRGRQPTEVLWE